MASRDTSTLPWEFIGKQELWENPQPGKGYAYQALLWRTPVPGGWLLMAMNARTNDPQPSVSFVPDPTHAWQVGKDPAAAYLLRPAAPNADPAITGLLTASDEQDSGA